MILIPKRELILPMRMQARVAGWYKLEARKLDGRIRPLTGWFPNLITNTGLDNLGGTHGYPWTHCVVGTGNTAPANTDTQLVAQVADTTGVVTRTSAASGTTPFFGTLTTTWQFPTGAAAGNLAEVGCGSSATTLFSRALILDGGGSPTTITVLADEALNVTYIVHLAPPLADVPGSVTIAGVNYTTNLRAALVGNSNDWAPSTDPGFAGIGSSVNTGNTYSTQALGVITSQPAGTGFPLNSWASGAYGVGTFQNTGTATWGINNGNAPGGVGSVLIALNWGTDAGFSVGGAGAYQINFTPVIPKDNTKVLTLTFQYSWARV